MFSKKNLLLSLLQLFILCLIIGQPVEAFAVTQVEVDLSTQLVRVKDGEELIRVMICSTGAPGTETPTGTFAIQNKGYMFTTEGNISAKYYSSFQGWGNYMFHTILFDKKGEGIITSAYKSLGKPASHGCIRLNVHDAKWIQVNIPQGTTVKILRSGTKGMSTSNISLNFNNKNSQTSTLRAIDNHPYLLARDLAKAIGATLNYSQETLTLNWRNRTLEYKISEPFMTIDGQKKSISTAPQLFWEGTYLPVESLCAALDLQLDQAQNSISLLTSDWLEIYCNQEQVKLKQPAIIRNTAIYVPVRSLAEQLQYTVDWDSENHLLTLGKTGKQPLTLKTGEDLLLVNQQAQISLRTLAEALGYTVTWEPGKVTLT